MNKQRYNRIIDDAYKNFKNNFPMKKSNPPKDYINSKGQLLTKEEFIDKCKTDKEFSERWGLKIEERGLRKDERYKLLIQQMSKLRAIRDEDYIEYNIPTKLITVTYKDEKLETYE
jgi:hypothetical protein